MHFACGIDFSSCMIFIGIPCLQQAIIVSSQITIVLNFFCLKSHDISKSSKPQSESSLPSFSSFVETNFAIALGRTTVGV